MDPIAADRGVTSRFHCNAGVSVSEDVVIFERPPALLPNIDAVLLVIVDTVAANRRVRAGPHSNAVSGIGEDVVVFERPPALLINIDAALLAVAVADDGIGAARHK